MKHKYALFEKCPDGLPLWWDSVLGFQLTRRRLQALAQISENQYYAIDLTTGRVLAFISERDDSVRLQKLKDEARAMLLTYGWYGCRILGEDQGFVCPPQLAN